MTASIRARSAIDFALSHSRDMDVIAGVKAAVAAELVDLDPLVKIKITDYFNHSFVPDLVVNWTEGGALNERNVYLRFTLRAASLGGDVSALAESGPIVLTLRENEDSSTREDVRQEVSNTARVLVTDVTALDEAVAVESSISDSPLLSLVRSNIVRGARGLLEASTVDDLVSASSVDADAAISVRNLDRFSGMVQELFMSDAATRLQRASSLIQLGARSDVEEYLQGDETGDLIHGLLSDVELRVLLPYLLSRSEITRSFEYWNYVGSMMDLKRLEDLSVDLEGLDLTPLVSANMSTWFGLRASLVMQADDLVGLESGEVEEEDLVGEIDSSVESSVEEVEQVVEDGRRRGWRMHAGMLSLNLENWRLYIASNGSRLRGRPDSLSARWDDLRPALEDFELTRVTLLGATRRVEIAAERDADVRSDVATISQSLQDSFYVPNAAVWEAGEGVAVAVEVDFKRMLAVATQKVSVGGLARVAIRLLGYRTPVSEEEQVLYVSPR